MGWFTRETEAGKLFNKIAHGECPDCGSTNRGFIASPSGGMSQNIKCAACWGEFNVTADDGIAERIKTRTPASSPSPRQSPAMTAKAELAERPLDPKALDVAGNVFSELLENPPAGHLDGAEKVVRAYLAAAEAGAGEAKPIGYARAIDVDPAERPFEGQTSFWCSERQNAYYDTPVYASPPPVQPVVKALDAICHDWLHLFVDILATWKTLSPEAAKTLQKSVDELTDRWFDARQAALTAPPSAANDMRAEVPPIEDEDDGHELGGGSMGI